MPLRRLLTLLLLVLASCTPTPEPPPNLLFILTDDQRFDMLGRVTPHLVTPHMDALARQGVHFDQAFVTTSICAASRASLLSGTVERTHRYTFITPPLARRFTDASYPALLQAAGYHTAHIGKFGVNLEDTTHALFDVFQPLRPNPYHKPQPDGTTRHLTDLTADAAIAYLEGRPADQPWALTLSFNAPHAEDGDPQQYFWPAAMDTLYAGLDLPAPPLADPAFYEALPPFLQAPTMNRFRWHWRFDTPEKQVAMTKGYYRMISGVDAAIGRVQAALVRLGRADDTVIVLMGDNGYFLGERGYAGKWLPYEPSLRVPLLLYDPRRPDHAGRRPDAMALNIDIAPTLLDLAGLPVPAAMQGRSLVPLLRGEAPADWRTDFFVEHLMDHPQIVKHEGVRGSRYTYARYFEQQPVYEEVYDLREDPLQTINLALDPAHAHLLAQLRARTDTLRDVYGGAYVPHP